MATDRAINDLARQKQHNRRRADVSLTYLWPLTVLVGIFIFVNTHPIRPHDFWWHMAVGREIVQSGQIPAVDTFSHTMVGTPYPSYHMFWLPEIALYFIYALGGPALIAFAQALLITGAYGLLLLTAFRISRSTRVAALITLIAAAPGINDWNVRPQTVTFPIAALFLLIITTYRARPHPVRLIIFPLGMMVWANSHGTFPLGLFLIGTWLADEAWQLASARLRDRAWPRSDGLRAPAIALATSALACLLNPQGLGILRYVTGITGSPAIQRWVTEWAPPSFETLGGQLFYGTLLLSVAILTVSRERPSLFQLVTLLALTALGLRTLRGSVWFGIVVAPTLAAHLPDLSHQARTLVGSWSKSGTRELRLLNTALTSLLAVSVVITLPWFKSCLPLPDPKTDLISRETPIEATRFMLEQGLSGPIFHEMGFGSYLIWAAQPAYPVFVDPRIELYPLELWVDYLTISAAQDDWEQALTRYNIRTLMLSPASQPLLIEAARAAPRWVERYADDVAVILTRR